MPLCPTRIFLMSTSNLYAGYKIGSGNRQSWLDEFVQVYGQVWALKNLTRSVSDQASTRKDGRQQTVYPSTRPYEQRIKIISGRPWWTSISWTDSDHGPLLFVIGGRMWRLDKTDRSPHRRIRTTDHKIVKCGRRWTSGKMDESPSIETCFGRLPI